LATNLAGYFANQKHKVSLCDLDRQQSALRWLAFRAPELPAITGYFGGNQMSVSMPQEADWAVLDAPAGFQGYKLNDYMRAVDRVLIPIVPSIFDPPRARNKRDLEQWQELIAWLGKKK
jgi:chromosome partitioning protein